MHSIGTGYRPPPRPSDAFATAVSDGGTRMLSAFVATNAMPRSTHIVPSVMMNGCTRSPTTSAPLSSPHAQPDADARRAGRAAPRTSLAIGPTRAQHERHRHAGQRVDRPDGEIDAAGDDHDRRADRHDREEARVGGGLHQRVRVPEVVDDSPVRRSGCEPASAVSVTIDERHTITSPISCEANRSSRRAQIASCVSLAVLSARGLRGPRRAVRRSEPLVRRRSRGASANLAARRRRA